MIRTLYSQFESNLIVVDIDKVEVDSDSDEVKENKKGKSLKRKKENSSKLSFFIIKARLVFIKLK